MDLFSFTELIKKMSNDSAAVDEIREIRPNSNAAHVLDMLCRRATETEDSQVRSALIETLREKSEAAAAGFSDLAVHSENPTIRKRAFVCLRQMECRTAKEAVIRGLTDTEPSVRIAAAYNAGLYEDADFIHAYETFLGRYRFSIVLEMVCEAIRSTALLYQKVENHLMKYLLYGGLKSGTKKT